MTKNLLLLGLFSLLSFVLKADVNYTNYGDGLVIPMEANYAMDVDQDGITDFLINTNSNELDFTPIFAQGCFSSPSSFALTSWGARELELYKLDMLINITDSNMADYIEDGRGGVYSNNDGLADGWIDKEDVYVGFAIFSPDFTKVSNGWLKVSADIENQALILKEMAFTDYSEIGADGIIVGDKGNATSTTNIDEKLRQVSITPNPTSDFATINLSYNGNTSIDLDIFTAAGRLIENQKIQIVSGNNTLALNTSDWDSGVYHVRLKTNRGIRTERLLVSH